MYKFKDERREREREWDSSVKFCLLRTNQKASAVRANSRYRRPPHFCFNLNFNSMKEKNTKPKNTPSFTSPNQLGPPQKPPDD